MIAEIATNLLIFAVVSISETEGKHYDEFLSKINFDHRQFARALEGKHKSYDPTEKMLGFQSNSNE